MPDDAHSPVQRLWHAHYRLVPDGSHDQNLANVRDLARYPSSCASSIATSGYHHRAYAGAMYLIAGCGM
jgi:hypothetical protein